jgi:hypothetical protein
VFAILFAVPLGVLIWLLEICFWRGPRLDMQRQSLSPHWRTSRS